MLTLYRGSNSVTLSEALIGGLNNQPAGNPLQPEQIVVQNYGMEQWLKIQIAQKQGIAANLDTQFPAEFMWKLYRRLDPGIPELLPSEKAPMRFAIFDILTDRSNKKSLVSLHQYIRADDLETQHLRAWQLSGRIADVFDRYLMYRPEMLLKWQQNKRHTHDKSERWQAALWQILRQHWKQYSPGSKWIHRAELHRKLLKTIDAGALNLDLVSNRISVFGIADLPPVFLKTFIALSALTDVNFYWFDPIGTTDNTHLFAEQFGAKNKTFLKLFHEYVAANAGIADTFKQIRLSRDENISHSLLNTLQTQLLDPGDVETEEDFTYDRSVQIHSCHSPLREVEVLYDQLLAVFEENADILPHDVAIMCPDMELYAPVIEAVFGRVEEGLPKIPFSITGYAGKGLPEVIRAFIKILALLQSRFKVTDVIELLQMPAIQEALNTDTEKLARLEHWIDENQIRWGIDGAFKKQFGLPQDESFTWQSGLSRMMLGYAMQQDDKQLFNGLLPYDAIGGAESAELLGNFYAFINSLFSLQKKIQEPKTAKAWITVLNGLISNILPHTAKYADGILMLRNILEQLGYVTKVSANHKIPFKIIESYLVSLLKSGKKGGYSGRGVTFSSLVAVQHIPFKMIGLLGMNEEVFPRPDNPVTFDLLQANPSVGDPDHTEDDRSAFLSILTNARQIFYISYSGQNNQQNVSAAPSVMVSELINNIEEVFRIDSARFITEHRLQPFSPHYFSEDAENLFSYSLHNLQAAQQLQHTEHTADEPDILFKELQPGDVGNEALLLKTLISFYQHPAKFVLQNVLGIYLSDEKIVHEDREPFELDNLARYQINQELLAELGMHHEVSRLKEFLDAKHLLPSSFRGDRSFNERVNEAQTFYETIESVLRDKNEAVEFNLLLPDVKLSGTLDEVYDDNVLLHRFGRLRAKDVVEWWLKHLAWCAITEKDEATTSHYYSFRKNSKGRSIIKHHTLSYIPNARTILAELINQFREGLQHPFPFFPKTSGTFAKHLILERKSVEYSLEKAKEEWKGSHRTFNNESEDLYNKVLFKEYNLLDSKKFIDLSKLFFNYYFELLDWA